MNLKNVYNKLHFFFNIAEWCDGEKSSLLNSFKTPVTAKNQVWKSMLQIINVMTFTYDKDSYLPPNVHSVFLCKKKLQFVAGCIAIQSHSSCYFATISDQTYD